MDITLSTSAFNDAARCLKRYEYRWVEGLVPRPKDVRPVLRRGVWIHRCLQLADEGKDWLVELGLMWQWAIEQDVDQADADQMYAEVQALCEDYVAYWAGHEEAPGPWTTEATEIALEWEPRPGTVLKATIDCLKRDSQGRLWIWERKSTQDIPDSDWRTADPQTMLQYMIARANGMPVAGIMFDYVSTRPGRVPRVTQQGRLHKSDETMQTRGRFFAEAEATMRKASQGDTYINLLRERIVSDAAWFQRYPAFRPDDNAVLTLRDVAQMLRHIGAAREKDYYARSLSVLDCRLFCPYGKLCMAEYQLGRKSEAHREEYVTLSNDDNWMMGRTG